MVYPSMKIFLGIMQTDTRRRKLARKINTTSSLIIQRRSSISTANPVSMQTWDSTEAYGGETETTIRMQLGTWKEKMDSLPVKNGQTSTLLPAITPRN